MTYLEAADKLENIVFKKDVTDDELLALAIAIKMLYDSYHKMEENVK